MTCPVRRLYAARGESILCGAEAVRANIGGLPGGMPEQRWGPNFGDPSGLTGGPGCHATPSEL
eukprot:3932884-Rhodomonas_salina.1